MTDFLRDLHYGVRGWLTKPSVTVVATATLALGIGANTALFSVVNGVLLQPLPYADPERLVLVWESNPEAGLRVMFASPPNYADWAAESTSTFGAGIDHVLRVEGFVAPPPTGAPEPSTLLMLGTGVLLFVRQHRRRSR